MQDCFWNHFQLNLLFWLYGRKLLRFVACGWLRLEGANYPKAV
uniref:Serine/threonine-protein kinase n=1 Tax=Rhizophora mucronata TaxID=61149 RepID=A0A2P2IXS7_RHIMU